jgi:hypothetical protein
VWNAEFCCSHTTDEVDEGEAGAMIFKITTSLSGGKETREDPILTEK